LLISTSYRLSKQAGWDLVQANSFAMSATIIIGSSRNLVERNKFSKKG